MLLNLRRSIVAVVAFTVFFGFIYMFAGTGVAQLFFNHQANGSITANGSTFVGQNWSSNSWFHGRPDATGPYASTDTSVNPVGRPGNNPLEANGVAGGSAATNLGPRSQVLLNNTKKLVAYWHARGVNPTPDLVTTSGSGLDPDITPQDALVQIPMVSKATGVSPAALRRLIASKTNGAQLGFLGSSFVNVLQLNEGLAKLEG
jgi:K+-transporting ATPase ATPase C chain